MIRSTGRSNCYCGAKENYASRYALSGTSKVFSRMLKFHSLFFSDPAYFSIKRTLLVVIHVLFEAEAAS